MSDAITLSQLRELSASAIQALPRATSIVNGETTIGVLLPIRKPSPEVLASISAELRKAAEKRSPEEAEAFEAVLDEREPA